MKVMARILALIALLALVVSAPVLAQSGQQPPKQPGTPAQPPAKQPGTPAAPGTAPAGQPPAPPVNVEEEAAYKAFFESKEDSLKVKLGEEFQEKFPTSRYRESVYASLTNAYQNLGQEEKMFATCDKTLAINADNLAALVTIAKALPRRTDAKALDAQQKFDKAEKYGKRALELLAVLPKPENVPEEAFAKARNDAVADVHSGLGLIYLHKGRLAESIAALEQATKVTATPDQVDFYLLGVALQSAKRFDEAVAAYGSCAAVASQLQETCKQNQAEAKKLAAAAVKAPAPAPPKP
jgi:tetratricopeptide (TPR) repeat protein